MVEVKIKDDDGLLVWSPTSSVYSFALYDTIITEEFPFPTTLDAIPLDIQKKLPLIKLMRIREQSDVYCIMDAKMLTFMEYTSSWILWPLNKLILF